jgi:hypothetical protein
MLPRHPECARCCNDSRCHFCLKPGQHAFEDGVHSFLCCTTHLLWLASNERAPGAGVWQPSRGVALNLPLDEIPSSMVASQGAGAQLLTNLGSLEPPAILRST